MKTSFKKDTEKNRIMAALSYMFIFVFVPRVYAKDSKFVQFHARQGLAIFVVEAILIAVFNIIPFIIPPLSIILLPFFILIYMPVMLIAIVLSVIGFVQALSGMKWKMPVVSHIADMLNA